MSDSTPVASAPRRAELLLYALLLAAVVVALRADAPPPALGMEAAPDVFSAGRAAVELQRIAAAPRALGSAHHAEVAEHLAATARALGFEVEFQDTDIASLEWEDALEGARVRNVIAVRRGEASTGALLVMGHYDSVPTGPGAGDDGAAVAAMLEAMRAIASGPRLKNDLIFLFTDAEEVGLLGSEAFVEQHPLAKQVAVALNFEGRGTRGPSLMFQTSPEAAWLVRRLASSTPHPMGTSLAGEVYARMPADTDLSAFLRRGVAGMNFAFIEGPMGYHTELDRPEALDPRSLQHHGENLLGLVRDLGQADFKATVGREPGEDVYFNLAGSFIRYPAWLAPWLAFLAAGVSITAIVRQWRARRIRIGAVAVSTGALILIAILAGAAAHVLWWGIGAVKPVYRAFVQGDTYDSSTYLLAIVALTVAVVTGCAALLLRRLRRDELASGAALLWALLAVGSALALPGASYVFAWPLLAASAVLLVPEGERAQGRDAVLRPMLLAVSVMVTGLIMTPVVKALHVALTISFAVGIGVLLALIALLLLPSLLAGIRRVATELALPALVVALGIALSAALTMDVRPETPLPSAAVYIEDGTSGAAYWATNDLPALDSWALSATGGSQQVDGRQLEPYLPTSGMPAVARASQALGLGAPNVTVLQDQTGEDGVRALSLRIRTAGAAEVVVLRLSGAQVLGLGLGRAPPIPPDALAERQRGEHPLVVEFWNPPAEGLEVRISVKPRKEATLRVNQVRHGLPAGHAPRPAGTIPVPFGFALTDSTILSTSMSL